MALKPFNTIAGFSVGNTGSITVVDSVGNVSANFLSVTANSNLGNYATANFFSGDGGLLTNISATTSNAIANGTSNVRIPAASGNINLSVGGTSNVLVVTSTGINVAGTLNTGTGNANVGNLGTAGLITATGNITGNYFIGNGSQLTGISAGTLANGTSNVSIPVVNGNINLTASGNTTLVVTGNSVDINKTANYTTYLNINNPSTESLRSAGIYMTVDTGSANYSYIVQSATSVDFYAGTDINIGASDGFINKNLNLFGSGNVFLDATKDYEDDAQSVGRGLFLGTTLVNGLIRLGGTTQTGPITLDQSTRTHTLSIGNGATVSANVKTINLGTNGAAGSNTVINIGTSILANSFITLGTLNATGNITLNQLTAVQNTTNSTSTTTGALIVGGGVGISGNLYAGGIANITGNLTASNIIGTLTNGTSNVAIPTSSGNINLTVGGGTPEFVVTSTGANVVGTLDVTGNTTVGNLIGTVANGTSNVNIVNNGNISLVRSGTTRLLATNSGVTVTGSFSATSKSFLIEHPLKPEMYLQYGSLESPYHGVRLTGEGVVKNGKCTILLPDYIRGLVKQEDSQVQLTNYKHGRTLYIDSIDVTQNMFIVKSNWKLGELKFFWSFTAIRKDVEDLVVEY